MYVDSSVIMGMTGGHDGTGFENIQYMVCRPENDFFPDLSKVRFAVGGRGSPAASTARAGAAAQREHHGSNRS